jgi:hypothetical protein
MPSRRAASWERLLLYGFVLTRDAVNAPKKVKDAFHGMVASYQSLGWLDPASSQLCVMCHGKADRWHHPSYERDFHDVVQPMCKSCHDRHHAKALRDFVKNGEAWSFWRLDTIAHVADPLFRDAKCLDSARALGYRTIREYRAALEATDREDSADA